MSMSLLFAPQSDYQLIYPANLHPGQLHINHLQFDINDFSCQVHVTPPIPLPQSPPPPHLPMSPLILLTPFMDPLLLPLHCAHRSFFFSRAGMNTSDSF